jgi:hypothetical protein
LAFFSAIQDMEVVINKEIMKLKFEEKDFNQLGRNGGGGPISQFGRNSERQLAESE